MLTKKGGLMDFEQIEAIKALLSFLREMEANGATEEQSVRFIPNMARIQKEGSSHASSTKARK